MEKVEVTLKNGWLISGSLSSFNNSPMVHVPLISSLNYYSNKKDGVDSRKQYYILFGIGSEIKWFYGKESDMEADFKAIVKLLIGAGTGF